MSIDNPSWFRQLRWSAPVSVAALNKDRSIIPKFTGCYVFTVGPVEVAPGRVLYVGEAARQTLRERVDVYLVRDYRTHRKRDHKGKGFVLAAREQHTDQGIYVRWAEYGAHEDDIHRLEASLIEYLNPDANDREESRRHPLLGERERLNARLIR